MKHNSDLVKQYVKQTYALEVGGKVDLHHVGSMPLLVIQLMGCIAPCGLWAVCIVFPTVCISASTPCSKAVIHCCVTKRSPRQRLRWITRELLTKLTRGDLLSQLLFPIRTPTQNESNDWSWLLTGWVVVQKKGGKVTRWRDRAMDPAYNESAPGYSVVQPTDGIKAHLSGSWLSLQLWIPVGRILNMYKLLVRKFLFWILSVSTCSLSH